MCTTTLLRRPPAYHCSGGPWSRVLGCLARHGWTDRQIADALSCLDHATLTRLSSRILYPQLTPDDVDALRGQPCGYPWTPRQVRYHRRNIPGLPQRSPNFPEPLPVWPAEIAIVALIREMARPLSRAEIAGRLGRLWARNRSYLRTLLEANYLRLIPGDPPKYDLVIDQHRQGYRRQYITQERCSPG